jgi:DNA-binding HxlR family transcriptional regulator
MKVIVPRSVCPVSFSLDFIGDKWTLLIIRDMIFAGKKSYNEFLASDEKIATNILSVRLKHLEKEGFIYKKNSELKKSRNDFYLTEKGISLVPVIAELIIWGDNYFERNEVNDLFKEIKADKNAVIRAIQERLLTTLQRSKI